MDMDLATQPWTQSTDGQRITVNAMIQSPGVVRKRIVSMLSQQFLADALLRRGPAATGGAVTYSESDPLFLDSDAENIAEYGEIPVLGGSQGQPMVARAVEKGLAVMISKKMKRRDDVGKVEQQLVQARNTMISTWEKAFLAAFLANPSVQQYTASGYWSLSATRVRDDLAEASYLIENADADSTNGSGTQKFMFNPDTLVISARTAKDFMKSDDINKLYTGNLADESLQYKGKLPNKLYDLNIVRSWRLPVQKAILLERGTVGFISDEQPLEVEGPLYTGAAGIQAWRWNMTRDSLIGLDQPKAAVIINGIRP